VFSKDEKCSELWSNVPHEARILGKGFDPPLVAGVEKDGTTLKIIHTIGKHTLWLHIIIGTVYCSR
jgi:hypothetical protein